MYIPDNEISFHHDNAVISNQEWAPICETWD
jgi:hypothetical protein